MPTLALADGNSLPLRCVLFLSDAITGAPIPSVPTQLTASFRSPAPGTADNTLFLGTLASDQVGYCSWDLSPLRRRISIELQKGNSFELTGLKITLGGPLETQIEALDLAQASDDA